MTIRREQLSGSVHCVRIGFAVATMFALTACASGLVGAQSATDDALEMRVSGAIANASDLPPDAFSIHANNGVVTIIGSVVCEDCGGMLTPGGIQSVQQTLGAVVRTVPGVERVEFDLEYQP